MHKITFTLLVIGGVNWLLEAFGWGLVSWVDAAWWGTLVTVIYIVVGLSAVYEIATHGKYCKTCCEKPTAPVQPIVK